ncbi:hypothetical protein JCM8097_008407 [Rhodosporidiobolus ruineniae]
MDSPPRSLTPERDDEFDRYAHTPTLPLPQGTYTLLPLVDACDKFEVPRGPWSAADCRKRWEDHVQKKQVRATVPDGINGGSALDDDEEEDESAPTSLEDEFLVPLFLALPPSAPSAPSTPARRSSSSSSSRPSFSRLTPLSPTSATRPSPPSPLPPTSAEASHPVGFLRPSIVRALIEDNRKLVGMNVKPVWRFDPPISFPPPTRRPSYGSSRPGSRRGSRTALNALSSSTPQPGTPAENATTDGAALDSVLEGLRDLAASNSGAASGKAQTGPWAVAFEEGLTKEERREHVDRIVRGWKMAGMFLDQLGGWRDEDYTIYGPVSPPSFDEKNANPLPGSNEAFRMERSACALFGVATFGVHCTAYVEEEGKPLRLWVPRRSSTKQTWPSMLDNTVAGGITAGDLPRYSILRECAEEASLPPHFVAPRLKQGGVITYCYRTKEGWVQPEVQYIYDLPLPPPALAATLTPTGEPASYNPTTNPDDGEVESFELLDLEDVVERMVRGEFKPNCALVLLDFFLRHGLLTSESDTRFLEIATRLHRPLGLPGPA